MRHGRRLTFINQSRHIVDVETASAWNLLGQAVEGSLAGQRLTPMVGINHFWFAWAAFRPETRAHSTAN